MQKARKSVLYLLCMMMITFAGCAVKAPATTNGNGPKIVVHAKGAEVVAVKHFMKTWQGKKRLHIQLGIKNTLSSPKRFEAKVTLVDSGQTNSALVPRKGKKKKGGGRMPAVIQPNKIAKTTLPFIWSKAPEKLVIKVAPQ